MNKGIRVLMLLPNLRVSNGVASFAMNYYRNLNHQEIQMDFAVYSHWESPYEEEITASGGHVFLLPPIQHLYSHLKECKRILKIGDYDIIHDNSMLITFPMMKIANRFVPIRILHSHNSKLGETKRKERRNQLLLPLLLHQSNAYAACSDMAAKAMFGESTYQFIPNIIDEQKYVLDSEVRDRIRKKMGVKGKKVIVTVGRVAYQKNPFFAVDVFNKTAERVDNLEYWWIGSGPLDHELNHYVSQLKHRKQIRLLGSREDIVELYQAADLFFLPSVFEGLPVTGIEAQVMGLPCIISDQVTEEMVYTDLVHFVSLEDSVDVWSSALEQQVNQEQERRAYNKELRNSVFSSNGAGTMLENYYSSLLDGEKKK